MLWQEFNKGIFDYLIATDDPAKRAAREPDQDSKQQPKSKQVQQGGGSQIGKRGRPEQDAEFGVIRGIDFKGVRTVINVDAPDTCQVSQMQPTQAAFLVNV